MYALMRGGVEIEFRHLRGFVAVPEEGFSQPCKRLHLAQPALSRQIRDLEAAFPAPTVRASVFAPDVRALTRRDEAGPRPVGQCAAAGRVELAQQLERVNERLRRHAMKAQRRDQRWTKRRRCQ